MSSILEIQSSTSDSLPTCHPHLMPFNIKYTGPAPISTYFRPKAIPPPTFGKSNTITASVEEETQSTQVQSQSTHIAVETEDVRSVEVEPQAVERYIASFRGRVVQGKNVDLPEGYTGILLKMLENGKSTAVPVGENPGITRSKSNRRTMRKSKHFIDVEEEDDVIVENDMGTVDEDDRPIRTLNLTSKFSSFVLWNPDIPVDEGKDEYLRSMTEWIKLSAEIHRCEY